MKRFVWAAAVALVWAVPCAIRLWLAYDLYALACYAAIVLALPFCSLMHELGHMLFGAFVKIKAVPKFSLFGSSSVKIIPKAADNLKRRLIVTAIGGLAVNALFAVAGIIGLIFTQCVFLCVFLPASAYLLYLNGEAALLPDGKTDGLVISELRRDTDEAKVTLAVLKAQALLLGGAEIGGLDEELLYNLPVIREDDPAFISLMQLRYEYRKARGEEREAEECRQRLEEIKKYL